MRGFFFGKSTIRLARTASVTELNCNTLNAESSYCCRTSIICVSARDDVWWPWAESYVVISAPKRFSLELPPTG